MAMDQDCDGHIWQLIPMLIRRMRGRKQVIAPKALDGEIPEAAEPIQAAVVQPWRGPFPGRKHLKVGRSQVNQRIGPQFGGRRVLCNAHFEC
jgi:hypothetical protein